VRGETTNA